MSEINNYNFNIASLLTEAAKKYSDKYAFIVDHKVDVQDRRKITFQQLEEESTHLAKALLQYGFKTGDRVIVMIPPGIDFVLTIFAMFKSALIPVMVDPGMGLKRMLACLEEGQPIGLIGIARAHILSLLRPKFFKKIKKRVIVGKKITWNGISLLSLLKKELGETQLPEVKVEDTAAILFTSGATGPAKGVVYSHGMFKAQIESIRESFGIKEGGVDLATFPLFSLFSPALASTSIVPDMNPTKPAKVDPRTLLGLINKYSIETMFASPALLARLAGFAHEYSLTLPSLKCVVSAGAPVRPYLVASAKATLLPEAKLFTPYGATEGVPLSFIESAEIINETKLLTEKGLGMCVGKPVNGVEIKVIKVSDKKIEYFSDDLSLNSGEIGEIIAKGPMLAKEYFNKKELNEKALLKVKDSDDFWRKIGDVGWIDAEGRLWFCGRKSQIVETEKGLMFTIPCEAIFNNHAQVNRAALVGVGPKGAQKPVMVIELHKGLGTHNWLLIEEELKNLAKANPRTININTFLKHSSFPVDIRHNAKINRELLAKWAYKQLVKFNAAS